MSESAAALPEEQGAADMKPPPPRRAGKDALWLTGQSLVIMFLGLISTALAARIYGPGTLGFITYAIAYSSLFAPIARLGLEGIALHEMVSRPQEASAVLWTGVALRTAASLLMTGVIFVSLQFFTNNASNPAWILIVSVSMLTGVGEIFLAALQAQGLIRPGAIARVCASVATAAMRIMVLLTGAPVVLFVATYALDALFMALAMTTTYLTRAPFSPPHAPNLATAKRLLRRGWPLIASGIAVALYGRIDQVMIGSLGGGTADTAIYAAAVTLGELWYFVPTALVTSLQVQILGLRPSTAEFDARVKHLYETVAAACIAICLGLTALSWLALWLLYGPAYTSKASVVSVIILTWAGFFAIMGVARGPWMIAHNLQHLSMVYLAAGCLFNVAANLWAIPRFGIAGAAAATLGAQILVTIVFPLAFSRTRRSVWHILGALRPSSVLSGWRNICSGLVWRETPGG